MTNTENFVRELGYITNEDMRNFVSTILETLPDYFRKIGASTSGKYHPSYTIGEGVMLNLDTPYECKRTKNLCKVKCFYDVDIRCLRIEKGTGRNANTLGAIVCDFKGNEVNVGSGFTDEQRDYYYNNPDEIIGKIVTVKYKEVSRNKNGGESLQFPVFVCRRTDKDQESYN